MAQFCLGNIPAQLLVEKIEKELSIPVLFVDMIQNREGKSISGAACCLEEMGVLLINRKEHESRRFFNLAHELFYMLTWDSMKPRHRESNFSFQSHGKINSSKSARDRRVEELADNFAAALLMPPVSLDQMIKPHQRSDVEHLCQVANTLKVAPISLAWRLFNLELIDVTSKEKLLLHELGKDTSDLPNPFSATFVKMLHHALENGQLSVRRAAGAMNLSIGALTKLFHEYNLAEPFDL